MEHIIQPLFDYQQKVRPDLFPSPPSYRTNLGFNVNFIYEGSTALTISASLPLIFKDIFSCKFQKSLSALFSYYWRGSFPAILRRIISAASKKLPLPDYQTEIPPSLLQLLLKAKLEAAVSLNLQGQSILIRKLEHLLGCLFQALYITYYPEWARALLSFSYKEVSEAENVLHEALVLQARRSAVFPLISGAVFDLITHPIILSDFKEVARLIHKLRSICSFRDESKTSLSILIDPFLSFILECIVYGLLAAVWRTETKDKNLTKILATPSWFSSYSDISFSEIDLFSNIIKIYLVEKYLPSGFLLRAPWIFNSKDLAQIILNYRTPSVYQQLASSVIPFIIVGSPASSWNFLASLGFREDYLSLISHVFSLKFSGLPRAFKSFLFNWLALSPLHLKGIPEVIYPYFLATLDLGASHISETSQMISQSGYLSAFTQLIRLLEYDCILPVGFTGLLTRQLTADISLGGSLAHSTLLKFRAEIPTSLSFRKISDSYWKYISLIEFQKLFIPSIQQLAAQISLSSALALTKITDRQQVIGGLLTQANWILELQERVQFFHSLKVFQDIFFEKLSLLELGARCKFEFSGLGIQNIRFLSDYFLTRGLFFPEPLTLLPHKSDIYRDRESALISHLSGFSSKLRSQNLADLLVSPYYSSEIVVPYKLYLAFLNLQPNIYLIRSLRSPQPLSIIAGSAERGNYVGLSLLGYSLLADELPKLYIQRLILSPKLYSEILSAWKLDTDFLPFLAQAVVSKGFIYSTDLNLTSRLFSEAESRYYLSAILQSQFIRYWPLLASSTVLFQPGSFQIPRELINELLITEPYRGQYLVYEKFPLRFRLRWPWLLSDETKLSIPSRFHIVFVLCPYPPFLLFSPDYFWIYSLFPAPSLSQFFHYIWKYKADWKSLLPQCFDVSGVRIFFEEEQEIPDFRVSFTFEELLTSALDLAKIFLSELADINRLLISIQLKEELQPELFITKLDWNITSFLSPELFTAYLNLESQFEQARALLGSKQAAFRTSYQQMSVKTYSVKLDFNFLIDILMDVWINVFEYVDAYLKAPWVIIPPS